MSQRKHLEPDELTKVFTVLHADVRAGNKLGLIIELMIQSGVRVDEVCKIEVTALRAARCELALSSPSKNSRDGTIGISMGLAKAIARSIEELALLPRAPLVWIAGQGVEHAAAKKRLQRYWHTVRLRALGQGCTYGLHSLRHTAAVTAYRENGNDVVAAQAMLRHKATSSTMRYLVHETASNASKAVRERYKKLGSL